MDNGRLIAVSPRHSLALAPELAHLIDRPPRQDFVVRTLVHREANGMPLMSAEIVIAGEGTRLAHPEAATYPLHFRKTYYPGRLHGDPADEYEQQKRAAALIGVPPPIGYGDTVFRTCLIPGRPYARHTPFGSSPPESNIGTAQAQSLPTLAGLWHLAEGMLSQLQALHAGGLVHGDAELHNCIVCPSPLEVQLIDFEASSSRKDDQSEDAWRALCARDLEPLLRESVFLQCGLGRQPSPLGTLAWEELEALFPDPGPFRRAIESAALV